MNNNPNDIRRPFPKRISRYVAKKRLGKGARPAEIDEYAKFYEDYLIKPILNISAVAGSAVAIYKSVTDAGKGVDMAAPVATAPLPPPLPLTPGLRQTPRFDWPIDRASPGRIQ